MATNKKGKEVKVTICPPVKQTVFFQKYQFDSELSGQDPVQYIRQGGYGNSLTVDKPQQKENASSTKRLRIKKAEQALKGHKNKEAILKILRSE